MLSADMRLLPALLLAIFTTTAAAQEFEPCHESKHNVMELVRSK
jgi:hypothetical protein